MRRLLLFLALLFFAAHLRSLPHTLEDIDSINFAMGVESFDVAKHQPHPPGYPVYIGLAKGAAFGLLIALVACHFGLRVKPNTESLSAHTTASVVSAITLVILADAVFAIATRGIGVPR